jgi:predicted membrane metal-binding protein
MSITDRTKAKLKLVWNVTAVLACNAFYLMILPNSIITSPLYWISFCFLFGTLGAIGTAYDEVSRAHRKFILSLVGFIALFFYLLAAFVSYEFITVAFAWLGYSMGAIIIEVIKYRCPGLFLRWYVTKKPPWR